jgi:hypothetical protein
MSAQTCFHHFYIYDAGNYPAEKKYEFGTMAIEGKRLVKTQSKMNEKSWMLDIKKSIDDLSPAKNGLLIYIHGYQGDNKYFVQQSGYTIQSEIFDNQAHKYGLAISLQWKSVIHYENAVNNAYAKGLSFVNFLDAVYLYLKSVFPDAPVAFISHSMGNRVWQGIYDRWSGIRPELTIDVAMMFAADLEHDIFNHGFSEIEKIIKHVNIYHHLSDRTLQMASTLKNHQRLGVTGPELPLPVSIQSAITIRNVTDIKDDVSFAGKLTYHRYYYGSPTIRKEIIDALTN